MIILVSNVTLITFSIYIPYDINDIDYQNKKNELMIYKIDFVKLLFSLFIY